MADNIKWLRLLRNQRKELLNEISRNQIEYEAKLLVEKKHNEWLSEKLISTQKKVRTLTYELEKKEVQVSDLRKQLRRETQLGGGAQTKTYNASDVSRTLS